MNTCRYVQTLYPSPLGVLTLVASPKGLRGIIWPDRNFALAGLDEKDCCTGQSAHFEDAKKLLSDYFAGKDVDTTKMSFDFEGTDLQIAVWKALLTIPRGTTVTYKELAKRIGNPTAIRAVASAVGKNPFSILFACHRVMGSDGKLHGFGGGLPAKEWLLKHEGVKY